MEDGAAFVALRGNRRFTVAFVDSLQIGHGGFAGKNAKQTDQGDHGRGRGPDTGQVVDQTD
jgi:hypothetical protein